jgi:hypothetical protein
MSTPVFHPTLWDATIHSIARKIGFWLGVQPHILRNTQRKPERPMYFGFLLVDYLDYSERIIFSAC